VNTTEPVGAGDGSPDAPYGEIHEPLDSSAHTGIMLVSTGQYAPISVRDQNVWIIGRSPGVQIRGGPSQPEVNAVTVFHQSGADQAVVTLERLTLTGAQGGSTAFGLQCGGLAGTPQITLVEVEVTDNQTGGLQVTGCNVRVTGGHVHANQGLGLSATSSELLLDRVLVEDNAGGGVLLDGSRFTFQNCIIARNGGSSAIVGGVGLSNPASPAELRHVTVTDNDRADALSYAGGVGCLDGDCSGVQLQSSIVTLHGTDGDLEQTITPRYCLIGDGSGAPGGPGNLTGDPGFVGSADEHLAPTSPCAGAGDPLSAVTHDFDGESRPRPAGTAPDCGADEVSQW
jgi:hypothetical protein